jgi:hemerythrin-like domain-containing protein
VKTPPKPPPSSALSARDGAREIDEDSTTTPLQTVAGLFERPLLDKLEPDERTEITAKEQRLGEAAPTHASQSDDLASHPATKVELRPAAMEAPKTRPSGAIPDLMAFHDEIRHCLEKLTGVVGNARNDVPDKETARQLVEFFEGPLLWHDEDEEVSLLRRLRARTLSTMHQSVVDATQRGHDKMEAMVDEVLAELRTIARGADAFDLAAFDRNARALRALLDGHLTLEETHLFPIVAELLSDAELEEVQREVRARHGRPSVTATRSRRAVPL